MHAPEIQKVKEVLTKMKNLGLIKDWELPYENILTRLSAAYFFVEPKEDETKLIPVWRALEKIEYFSCELNEKKLLSEMKYQIQFNKEKMEKMKQDKRQALKSQLTEN